MSELKKILVTGGAGNVGSSLVKGLLSRGNYAVTVIDDLSTGNKDNLEIGHERLKFFKTNVNDRHDLSDRMLAEKFDYVFHYAAYVGVKRTQENPIKVLDDIDGIKNILSLSRNTNVKRVFFSSSSEVYGEPVSIPQNEETTPLNSRVPYAVVKNVGEAFCRSYQKEYGLDYTIFRFFNTFGPEQTADFVISKFIKQAITNSDITIYGDGSQTRTFCFVEDNVEVTIKALENDHFINDVVNIGGERIISIKELAELIINKTNSKSKIVHLPPLADGDMTRRQADNSKMKEVLGRKLITLEDGIERLINNEDFLQKITV